jgi:hypothetical protein
MGALRLRICFRRRRARPDSRSSLVSAVHLQFFLGFASMRSEHRLDQDSGRLSSPLHNAAGKSAPAREKWQKSGSKCPPKSARMCHFLRWPRADLLAVRRNPIRACIKRQGGRFRVAHNRETATFMPYRDRGPKIGPDRDISVPEFRPMGTHFEGVPASRGIARRILCVSPIPGTHTGHAYRA